VAALAFFSWWLNQKNISPPTALDSNLRHDPDYFAEDLVVYSLDASGKPQHQLQAEHLYHYPDDKSTQLTSPHFVFYRDQNPEWEIDAAQGHIMASGDEVFLSGGVMAKQTPESTSTPLTLTTEDILIHPDKKQAQTDKDVLLQDKFSSTHATGMKVDIADNTIKFLSNVRGQYARP
jgi:lipopolysaccharide export system protein LptC